MSKQVVVIHGGTTFDSYEEYIEFLKNREVDIDTFKYGPGWKNSLQKNLNGSFEVLLPRMPNSNNAKYEEWKIWFERLIPFLEDGVILVGHSMGGIFLPKYLSENDFPKKIRATILVAAPFDDETEETLDTFRLPNSIKGFGEQSGKIFLYQSKDDPEVPFGEVDKYKKLIPQATLRIFEDRGHFNTEEFPEIVEEIKNI